MVGQPEQPVYDALVYQWETTDPVQGAVGGIANAPILSLANRTAYLKQRLDSLVAGQIVPPGTAPLNGPAFTGSPTAPNVSPGDDSTRIANTDFVQTKDHGTVYITTQGGNVTLTQDQWGVGIIIVQGVLTQAVNILFPNIRGRWIVYNATTGPWTLTAKTPAGGGLTIVQNYAAAVWSDGLTIIRQDTALTGSGEVNVFDLTKTGVTPGSYALANIIVGQDGRISGAVAGNPTLAQVIGALGFTPVQQGGGAGQGSNKIYLGWDQVQGRLRAQVDSTDVGGIPLANEFTIGSNAVQEMHMQLAAGLGQGKMYIQMGAVTATHTGSGVPETTLCPLNVSFPHSLIAVTGSYLGNSPPSSGPPAFQPFSNTTLSITTNFNTAQAALGCVYLAIGT